MATARDGENVIPCFLQQVQCWSCFIWYYKKVVVVNVLVGFRRCNLQHSDSPRLDCSADVMYILY
jgi:hypothetical protein